MNNAATDTTPEIPPKFIACFLDISHYFEDTEEGRDLLKRCGGKIFYSGFFDDSVNTHLCSFSPSVWVEVLSIEPECYPEKDPERNDLNEELLGLVSLDDDGYWNRRDIERMRKEHPDRFRELDFDFDEDLDDRGRHDEVRDELSANPEF